MQNHDRDGLPAPTPASSCSHRTRKSLAAIGRALAGTVLAAAAVGAIAVVPASARTSTHTTHAAVAAAPVTPGSGYLALGDSVTFGYAEPQVVPAPDYADAASFIGYPEQLGSELHLEVANLACPGETSASLINASAQSNGCENTPTNTGAAYRKLYPLHVRYKGSQLAYAVSYLHAHPKTRLVSLMIGANDLFICQETTSDGCSNQAEQDAVLAKIGRNVKTILSAIRTKAHYAGQLAIVNYYSLDYASATADHESTELNQTVDAAARPFRIVVANGYKEFEAAAHRFGGESCQAGLLTQLGTPGNCGVHPSYAGAALLAQSLEKVIRL